MNRRRRIARKSQSGNTNRGVRVPRSGGRTRLKDTRNNLAHSYLVTHQPFIDHPDGQALVIAQLRHYAHNFKIATDLFSGLLSHLLTSIMGSPHCQAAFMKLWQEAMADAVESVGLEHYRKKLQECGAI